MTFFSRKTYIQHKQAGRWALMVNCAYPKVALPIDIERYRAVMMIVLEYPMTDKTAYGASLFGAEPPYEEEGVPKEEGPQKRRRRRSSRWSLQRTKTNSTCTTGSTLGIGCELTADTLHHE